MFYTQIFAIIITSSTAIVIITVQESGLSCRDQIQSTSSCTRWAMSGARATSFPEEQRQTKVLPRQYSFTVWGQFGESG